MFHWYRKPTYNLEQFFFQNDLYFRTEGVLFKGLKSTHITPFSICLFLYIILERYLVVAFHLSLY
jgi:hypothetical protein